MRRFQAAASQEAAQLAAHIALAVPYLPVMRLIQHRIIRSSEPSDLAQVLLSGLLRPVDGVPGLYDFLPGAREELLRTLPRAESLATAAVLERVSAAIQERAGTAANTFRAVINVAEGTGSLSADAAGRPFALIDPGALSMLTHATSPAPGAAPPEEKVEVTSVVSGADAPPGTFPEPTPGVLYAANFGGRSFVLRLPLVVPSRIPVLAETPPSLLA